MIILIPLLIVLPLVIILITIGCYRICGADATLAAIFLNLIPVSLFIALLVSWLGAHFSSEGESQALQAFYHDTLSSYQYVIDETGRIEITGSSPGIVDVAHAQQAQAVSERLQELRDKVDWYNGRLRWFHHFQDGPISGPFVANIPNDLKPIYLGDLDATDH